VSFSKHGDFEGINADSLTQEALLDLTLGYFEES
jgi:hypothetical protein